MKNIYFVLLFISMAAVVNAQSLKGSAWLLKSIDETETGKSQAVEAGWKVALVFDSDSVYSGFACDKYKGIYSTANAKNLTMQKAGTVTNPNCLGLGILEKQLLALYLKVTRYKMDNDRLFIFTSDDHRLIFQKK